MLNLQTKHAYKLISDFECLRRMQQLNAPHLNENQNENENDTDS